MNPPVRALTLLAAAALAAHLAGAAPAQSLPPQPVPVAPPPTIAPGPPAPPTSTGLTPPPLTPPPDFAPPLVYHDPLPSHDALLEAASAPPGWFAAAEVDVVTPHVTNRLIGNVFFPGAVVDVVHVPGASLDWTVAPRFELGYRFADDCGEVLFSYRNLSTDGRAIVPDYDAPGDDGFLRSRLSLNVFDFDYGGPAISLGRHWDLKWRAGVRLADVYFDTHVFGQFADQGTRNRFTGAGPHAGLDLWYHSDLPGLGVFARVEGALPIGHVGQRFEESFVLEDGSTVGGGGTQGGTRVVPTLNAQLGVGWHPPGTRLRFSTGYQYEQWWNVGHVGDSRGGLFDQGAFFRAEFSF
jgi:hypothetical protein